jgi:predicted nucleotidyltransferase
MGRPVDEHLTVQRVAAMAGGDQDVLAVIVFGSAARGDAGPASDIDVCLVLRPDAAVDPSEKRLAYLARVDLDVHIFQQLPLYVRRRVLREGHVTLSKDDDALYALALRTAKAFEDFRHVYSQYLDAVAHTGP